MISVDLQGRLGNHLFQYAACRAIAETRNLNWYIPKDFLGSSIFDCDLGQSVLHYDSVFDEAEITQVLGYLPEAKTVKDGTKLRGFFQTHKYWEHMIQDVTSWFQFKHKFLELHTLLELDKKVCLIHFRGTDYSQTSWQLPQSYYLNAIEHVSKIHGTDIEFLVVTDDVARAKTRFPLFPIINYDIEKDLWLLSNARYLILSNSSFSYWAGFLNNRAELIIAPKYWLWNNSKDAWLPADIETARFTFIPPTSIEDSL